MDGINKLLDFVSFGFQEGPWLFISPAKIDVHQDGRPVDVDVEKKQQSYVGMEGKDEKKKKK